MYPQTMSLISKFNLLKLNSFYSIINRCDICCTSSLLSTSTSLNRPDFEHFKIRCFHSSAVCCASNFKPRDRRELVKTALKKDEGTQGEHVISLDAMIKTREDMLTDENTPNLLFSGIPFREIPVLNIKVTKNNTKVALCNYDGKVIVSRSCGVDGFKNCRKGTNVAGQTTALAVSSKAVRIGIRDVRLKIQGLGPGRMASIKGTQMGGLNIISVTDDTRISFRPSTRPRKARRL